jgi:Carboxypeptidase regulatory-like domain
VKRLVRSFGVLVLSGALGALSSTHVLAAAVSQAAAVGSLSGTASSSSGQVMANTVVQLRNLATGQLAGMTTSNLGGQFSFIGLNPGNYAVEVVNAAGQIVGTSASVALSAGAAVTGVSVTASVAVSATAGLGATGAAAGSAGGASTATIIGAAAAAAGVAGAAFTNQTASPSQ